MFNAILLFYAGIIIQAFFILLDDFDKNDIKILALCIGTALFGFVPGKHENNYDLYIHLFTVAIIFACMYGTIFKKKILQKINKEVLIIWDLILIYLVLRGSLPNNTVIITTIVIASLPSIINIIYSLDKKYVWRVFLYVWFLCILVFVSCSHIAFSNLYFFFNKGVGIPTNAWEMFLLGGSFLFIVINIFYVLELIPIAGKHQTEAEKIAEVKADMAILASEYESENIGLKKSLIIISGVIAILLLNFFVNFISDTILISLLIAIIPLMDRFLFKITTQEIAE